MQGVIPPSFIMICWADNEKIEVEVLHTFTVTMATAAILKISNSNCTTSGGGLSVYEVSGSSVQSSLRNAADKNYWKKNNNN